MCRIRPTRRRWTGRPWSTRVPRRWGSGFGQRSARCDSTWISRSSQRMTPTPASPDRAVRRQRLGHGDPARFEVEFELVALQVRLTGLAVRGAVEVVRGQLEHLVLRFDRAQVLSGDPDGQADLDARQAALLQELSLQRRGDRLPRLDTSARELVVAVSRRQQEQVVVAEQHAADRGPLQRGRGQVEVRVMDEASE